LWTRGASSDAPSSLTSALFGAKIFEVFEIYDVSARTRGERGLSQCGYFADKGGRGINFRDF